MDHSRDYKIRSIKVKLSELNFKGKGMKDSMSKVMGSRASTGHGPKEENFETKVYSKGDYN